MAVEVTVDILEADAATLVASVDPANVVDGSVQDMLTGDSLGELAVGLESPQRADLEVEGRVLRWNGTGDEPFHSLVERNGQVSLTESLSKVPRQVTVRGRGLIAQWEAATVGQWPGMQAVPYYTRHFNCASPGKASEINGTCYDHGPVLDYDSNGQPNQPDRPPPTTWREPTARRIGAQAFNLDVPDGRWLFRSTITTGTTDLILRGHSTADDRFVKWVGGVPVKKGATKPDVTWLDTWPHRQVLQPSFTYDVVIAVDNEFTALGGSACWLGDANWLLQYDGSELDPAKMVRHSDATNWDALDIGTGPAPGWTVPEMLGVLLDEWQPEYLTGWVIVDMAGTVGVDWEELQETNFETRKTTGLAVLQQFEADGQAEFDARVVDGVKELRCYPPGTMGDFHTSPVSPPEPSARELTALSHQWVDRQ